MATHTWAAIMAEVLDGKADLNPWRDFDWPAIPGYFGKPVVPAVRRRVLQATRIMRGMSVEVTKEIATGHCILRSRCLYRRQRGCPLPATERLPVINARQTEHLVAEIRGGDQRRP